MNKLSVFTYRSRLPFFCFLNMTKIHPYCAIFMSYSTAMAFKKYLVGSKTKRLTNFINTATFYQMDKYTFFSKIFFYCLLSLATTAQAQYTIATDRPGATFSSQVVPQDIWQVEVGYALEQDEVAGTTTRFERLPNTVLRYGLTDTWELRAEWDYLRNTIETNNTEATDQGAGLLTLGTKFQLLQNKSWWQPRVAFIGAVQLPTFADEAFQPDFTGSYFRFLLMNQITKRTDIFYNLGADFGATAAGAPQLTSAYTLGIGTLIGEQWYVYGEIFGFFPEEEVDRHSFDVGIAYIFKSRYQLDFAIGYSLNEYATDSFINAGFSTYFGQPKQKN